MDPISRDIHRQYVDAFAAKRRAELVAAAAQHLLGSGPSELCRVKFKDEGLKQLRIHADGSFRIVCGASGRILAEGPFSELTAQAATSGTANT